MAAEAPDDPELAAEAERLLPQLDRALHALEVLVLLHGPHDGGDAIVSVHPGAGGTESQDWAQMLLRMYTRWAERRGLELEILDWLAGEEAGIKSATFAVHGAWAYGLLQAEKGVHRLVRISPFDASGRRHTSFASVDVLPDVPEAEIEIKPEDLRIDVFRSSGAGGQHVNKTESAVRIVHLPTGIVVSCQNERSQHSNRESAMMILRARLAERREQEKEREQAAARGSAGEIAFGSQIRSYVLHPYTMVKDHRTGVETGNVQAVLDGDIDPFVDAFLAQKAREEAARRTAGVVAAEAAGAAGAGKGAAGAGR
jgi:peptide chain release factor 2